MDCPMEDCPICLDSYKFYDMIELHVPNKVPHKVCRDCAERLEKKERNPVLTVRNKGHFWSLGLFRVPYVGNWLFCVTLVSLLNINGMNY